MRDRDSKRLPAKDNHFVTCFLYLLPVPFRLSRRLASWALSNLDKGLKLTRHRPRAATLADVKPAPLLRQRPKPT